MKNQKQPVQKPQMSVLEQPKIPRLHPQRKEWEDLTIADDYMFKLVMRHKRICKHLLEIILGVKIRKITAQKQSTPSGTAMKAKGCG